MSHAYSESNLIEGAAMGLLSKLGWQTMNLQQGETFGIGGSIGRDSEQDALLRAPLLRAMRRLNPGLPEQALGLAYDILAMHAVTQSPEERNHEKYHQLRDGVKVTFKNDKGELVRDKQVQVIDYAHPESNEFLAVQQLWIVGKNRQRFRPDIICFVNGIPLVFLELKAHHRKLRTAYEESLRKYLFNIPQVFDCNALILLSNGLESKVGAITSSYRHYMDWKRITEEEEGVVSMDTMLRGTCDKVRLLDLLENFILFDQDEGKMVKLIARNHQFIGVNKAYAHFQEQRAAFAQGTLSREDMQRMGVFWHTQGSGKSYSMVFLCQKILRKLMGGATFLIVTDRKELDTQIYKTFKAVGAVTNERSKAEGGEHLQELLRGDERYVFSLIQKFNFHERVSDRDNLIVISDEAHRTQGGSLAMNMRQALPHAAFLGFTGTPLFKDDQITRRLFGEYVSVYDFKRSVEDGATVPLFYENRGQKLQLTNPEINEQIREVIEATALDSDQEAQLKRLFQREYPILTAEKRLREIAKDLVWHFNNRGFKGKAMLVCLDKLTAVRMHGYVTEEWARYLTAREHEIERLPDLMEQLEAKREWKWMAETEIAVVVSPENNEIQKFHDWGLDILPHREKMNARDLEKEFKDDDHPFRIAIVCAMWITGFDVPSLSTLYLDKPLKSHTLMQAIARANRTYEGKNNGLIVDYIETYTSLLEALAIYAVGGGHGGGSGNGPEPPVRPLEDLIAELTEAAEAMQGFWMEEVNYDLMVVARTTDSMAKIAAIADAENAVYATDAIKSKFGVMARELFKKYKAVLPDAAAHAHRPLRDAVDAIYRRISDNTSGADVSYLMRQVQDVVDRSVENEDLSMEPSESYGVRVDLSGLDFDLVQAHFARNPHKHTEFQSLRSRVEEKLAQMVEENPLRVDFYTRYQEIIDEYNLGKERATVEQTFHDLLKFIRDLNEEATRASREDLDEAQLAVFDLLISGKQLSAAERKAIKALATDLLNSLKKDKLTVPQWVDKPQTAAAVRQTILDQLFEKLPYPTFVDEDIANRTDSVFVFIRDRFGNRAA